MSAIYENWERLVAAVLKKQELSILFHDHSRSPSVLSEASDFSSSFDSGSSCYDLASPSRSLKKLVLLSDFRHAIDVKYLYPASFEFLDWGTFGMTYALEMDSGKRIVVRRLKPMSMSEQSFKRHMDVVGSVRHENVVALRAYYSAGDERIVMYDYYLEGSVHTLLHGHHRNIRARVDWESRLKIVIGAARGIAEIHKHKGGNLFHGNIRASNVFLNPDRYGCISELGLANLIETTFRPIPRCHAPEVKNSTKNASQASDVYSFGILLLEILTRKSPAYIPYGPKPANLVKLVTSVINRIRAANVFDADLLKNPIIKDQMVKMLQIGMRCVEKSAIKRPKMYEVVNLLEEIIVLNPKIGGAPVEKIRKLVFIENSSPTFDLEDVLKASSNQVRRDGTFGSSYQGRLEDGTAIMVKRLKDLIVTFGDFRDHMEVIGRMRHENIAAVRAYYFGKDELQLLVYDYYNQGSVFALLHGKMVKNKSPLLWETRLKIAVGAARGISHIHKQDGQNFVHGNIKSSNIFLNRQKYGIVSDFGLAKLMSPIKRPGMLTHGYYAPEVKDTSNVSQASDVYSFGVLLLELLSGKHSHFRYEHKVTTLAAWMQSVVQSVVRDKWITRVFDSELVEHGYDERMIEVLHIAMDCVNVVPESRPRMPQVMKMLEEISGVGPEFKSEDTWDWEQPSLESRLEIILEDLLPTLMPYRFVVVTI